MALNQVGLERLNTATTKKIGTDKNIIINGAMQVAQRGTSGTALGYGSVDRIQMIGANLDQLAFAQKQTSDGPDGFSKCFEFDVTTVENALDADDLVYAGYRIEGQDLEQFFNANGTGKDFTISFYVKAYQAGTYQFNIYKSDGPRFIAKTYTVDASATWQRVVIPITGDTNTTGMLATTGSGFNLSWIFAAGTNYTSGSTQTTWGAWPGNTGFAAGQAVNTASSTDNYFRITGIQLELGSEATPFEHRSFGEELALCQRYCYKLHDGSLFAGRAATGGTRAKYTIATPVPMRASPSIVTALGLGTWSGTGFKYNGASTSQTVPTVSEFMSPNTHITFSQLGHSLDDDRVFTWQNNLDLILESEI